jgi:hypothetical protein
MAFVSSIKLLSFSLIVRVVASYDGFLSDRRGHISSSMPEFRDAMGSVMGCGGEIERDHIRSMEKELLPMWQVLPKNDRGFVEWKMVRYLAHRHFMQKSSLLIRGFEPLRQINASSMGAAQILETHALSIVDNGIKDERSRKSYSLEETVAMIATLDQLISNDEATRLENVYTHLGISTKNLVSAAQLGNVVEAYMVVFIMEGDREMIDALLAKPKLRHDVVPRWADVRSFIHGLVKETEFRRRSFPRPGHSHLAWSGLYSFVDAHDVISRITRTFASFWEDECQVIKRSLAAMDRFGTGRLSLTDFYGANADGEWRFGESETYLRDLGALDETSIVRGKQVIIPNYLQGASNCIIATSHYLVCCVNECESVLNEIEDAVGGPLAQPEEILALIGNMTGIDEETRKLDASLNDQLQRISRINGGKVLLHGRLFAQWLHYVFPRECQFPHKAGSHTAHTPFQYGAESLVKSDEVAKHAAVRNESVAVEADLEDPQWMSQWSEEEELLANYSLQLESPWDRSGRCGFLFGAILLITLSAASAIRRLASPTSTGASCDFAVKSHCV